MVLHNTRQQIRFNDTSDMSGLSQRQRCNDVNYTHTKYIEF